MVLVPPGRSQPVFLDPLPELLQLEGRLVRFLHGSLPACADPAVHQFEHGESTRVEGENDEAASSESE